MIVKALSGSKKAKDLFEIFNGQIIELNNEM
jgi:hypothetical protein